MSSTLAFRLPTCAEYNEMLRITNGDNTRCHWKSIYTLCQDKEPNRPGCRVARGFLNEYTYDYVPEPFSNTRLGFRPFLEIIEEDPFPNVSEGAFVSFGILTLGGIPVHVPRNPVAPTSFYMGDIPKAYDSSIGLAHIPACHPPITWIKQGGGYIADRVLLCKISWDVLHKERLSEGVFVHFFKYS